MRPPRRKIFYIIIAGRTCIAVYYANAEQLNEALECSPALQAVTRSFLTAAAALVRRDGAAGGQNR